MTDKRSECDWIEVDGVIMTERRDDALFGYAELEHTDGSDDVDIHFWPTDADHILDVDLTCDCKPKIELQWANGTRVIIHRKTQ